jgi:dipeptidyl-peptidase-4
MTAARRAFALVVLLVWSAAAHGQTRALSIDVIYDPQQRVNFSGTPTGGLSWLDETSYLMARRGSRGTEWLRVDAVSGRETPLFDVARMVAALTGLTGVDRDQAAGAASSSELTFNPSHTGALVTIGSDLYFYDIAADRATRLTSTPGEEELPSFSPDGARVAFVRDYNLHVVDVVRPRERALTRDGRASLLNGKLDWLYQEEIYGRGVFRGYWWSPDSTRLAFLQLDEQPVPEYTIVDDISYRPVVEVTDYPKAGDPNPKARLGVVAVAGGDVKWLDLDEYRKTDFLIVRVGWTPDSRNVMHQIQDREQTWLDLNLADARSGRARRLLRETSKAWVNVQDGDNPVWLGDGSFVWISERSGFRHLYHYDRDGRERRAITSGRWDVRALAGVDEKSAVAYFTSGQRRHIDTDVFRVRLDGADLTRLSRTGGTHQPNFNPTFTLYIDSWSDVNTPVQVRLHRSDGAEARVIDANAVPALKEFRLSAAEFVEVTTRDGFVMDGMLIKPANFDATRRYPVYQFTYAGPGTSVVRNQWGGSQYMFHQFLAQQGFVVWLLDNRSAGGKGIESQWPVYGRLGELELQDLEDGVAWLRKQTFVDGARLVLSGWSYGGFMTSYALTHSASWAAGIAGGSVTDWRNYDTVYTERFMKTPQNNADGYRRTAPRFAADKLSGKLLLVHGGIDDNVHPQNTMQFAYELQRANKPFELMMYPKSRHGVTDARLNKHLRQLMFDFLMRTVGRSTATTTAP